ncbi:MAG: penicillin-binding protein activator LpoB [Burkholderiales bacterium]|nr:penicillin-binding protein activator LpoB [Burkholderiales bacterium]
MRIALTLALAALLAGCTVTDRGPGTATLDKNAKWALLPIVNHTDTPQAGLRAESITDGLLRARGVGNLVRYPAAMNPETLFEPAERKVQDEARKWARAEGARYGVYGAVDEWRYKVGVDGEPAVGVALFIVDLQSGEVLWSAVGGKSGWSREALAAVGQKLIRELLASARIE